MTTPGPPPDPWSLGPTPPPTGPPQPTGPPPPWTGPPPPAGWPQQPGWQQQPGWPAGPWSGYAPPRRSRAWIPWVVLAAFLVVGGCSAVVATVGVKAFHEFDGVRGTADDFFVAAERGDVAAAQDLACDEAPAGLVRNEVDAGIVDHHISGVSVQRSGFGDSAEQGATVTASLTLSNGVHEVQRLFLRREREKWRVCVISPPLLR